MDRTPHMMEFRSQIAALAWPLRSNDRTSERYAGYNADTHIHQQQNDDTHNHA